MRTLQKMRHLQAPASAAALPSPPGAGRPSPPLMVVSPSDGRHPQQSLLRADEGRLRRAASRVVVGEGGLENGEQRVEKASRTCTHSGKAAVLHEGTQGSGEASEYNSEGPAADSPTRATGTAPPRLPRPTGPRQGPRRGCSSRSGPLGGRGGSTPERGAQRWHWAAAR